MPAGPIAGGPNDKKASLGEGVSQDGTGTLAGIELLQPLDADEIRALEACCSWRRYKTGEQVLDRESPNRDVFFVAEGRCQIVNFSLSGREIAYAAVAAGGYFGELSAIDGESRSASVVAAGPALLAAMAPTVFTDMLKRHPEVALTVMRRLARIVRTCDDRIMDLSTLGAVQRVYVELLRLAKPDPVTAGAWIIYPMPTQSEIASLASTTRETVARVISQLAGDDLISRKGKTVHLRDRARLETLAERLSQTEIVASR